MEGHLCPVAGSKEHGSNDKQTERSTDPWFHPRWHLAAASARATACCAWGCSAALWPFIPSLPLLKGARDVSRLYGDVSLYHTSWLLHRGLSNYEYLSIYTEWYIRTRYQVINNGILVKTDLLNPFRTAVPFRGQTDWNLSRLSPKRDCGSKR